MLLAENFKIPLSASIAFDRSNANGRIPNPLQTEKEQEYKEKILIFLLLFFFLLICQPR